MFSPCHRHHFLQCFHASDYQNHTTPLCIDYVPTGPTIPAATAAAAAAAPSVIVQPAPRLQRRPHCKLHRWRRLSAHGHRGQPILPTRHANTTTIFIRRGTASTSSSSSSSRWTNVICTSSSSSSSSATAAPQQQHPARQHPGLPGPAAARLPLPRPRQQQRRRRRQQASDAAQLEWDARQRCGVARAAERLVGGRTRRQRQRRS